MAMGKWQTELYSDAAVWLGGGGVGGGAVGGERGKEVVLQRAKSRYIQKVL